MNDEEQWKHWNQDDINQSIGNTLASIFNVIESQQELIDMIAEVIGLSPDEEE